MEHTAGLYAALTLAPIGSAFRQQVWNILCEIPYGEVMTYGGIAKKMAAKMGKKSMSSQAVGGAIGHNPISIIIPCHRVIGSGGSLTGYAGGVDKKIKLLALEGVDMSGMFCAPKGHGATDRLEPVPINLSETQSTAKTQNSISPK